MASTLEGLKSISEVALQAEMRGAGFQPRYRRLPAGATNRSRPGDFGDQVQGPLLRTGSPRERDGAVWIWNLAGDRFAGARQRVDFQHVRPHLWSVAHRLRPDDATAPRAWVKPLLDKFKAAASCGVITELEPLQNKVEGAARERIQREAAYLQTRRDRLNSGPADKKGEPLGSRVMASPYRKYPVRSKPTGQFGGQVGGEALLSLETFRHNGRWHLLCPHALALTPSRN